MRHHDGFGEEFGWDGANGGGSIQQVEALSKSWEVAVPEAGEEGLRFFKCGRIGIRRLVAHIGSPDFCAVCDGARFRAWSYWGRLVISPTEDVGDLLREGEGVEGFEEDGGDVEVGEASLVYALDLGGEQ